MNSPKASQKRLRHHHQEPDWHSNWLSLGSPEQANLFARDLSGEATRQPRTRVPGAVTLFDPGMLLGEPGAKKPFQRRKEKANMELMVGRGQRLARLPTGREFRLILECLWGQ